MKQRLVAGALVAALAGCRVPPRGGLDEVSRLLKERGAAELRWNQSRSFRQRSRPDSGPSQKLSCHNNFTSTNGICGRSR